MQSSVSLEQVFKHVDTNLDHIRRRQSEPLVQADVLVDVRLEDLEELEGGIADVLDVVSERRRDISWHRA